MCKDLFSFGFIFVPTNCFPPLVSFINKALFCRNASFPFSLIPSTSLNLSLEIQLVQFNRSMKYNTALAPLATTLTMTWCTLNWAEIKRCPICSLSAPETQLKWLLSNWGLWWGGEFEHGEATQPASIKTHKFRHQPAGVDDSFLFQLAPSARWNSGKEQREQSLGSSTCLPPPLPHPIRKSEQGEISSKGLFLHVLDLLATSGSQPDLARNAKPQTVFSSFFFFFWRTIWTCWGRGFWYYALNYFFLLISRKAWYWLVFGFLVSSKCCGKAPTSRMCSSCCSRSNFLEVVVTRPVRDRKWVSHLHIYGIIIVPNNNVNNLLQE